MPPTRGARAGETNLETYLDPAMTDPPIKKGLMRSIILNP